MSSLKPTNIVLRLQNLRVGDSGTLAFADVEFNDLLIVKCRVVRAKNGNTFLAFPQEKDRKTEKFHSRVLIKDSHLENTAGREFQERLHEWVMTHYKNATGETTHASAPNSNLSDWD